LSDSFGKKRVLVTGGAGFIGANLVRRLCAEGATVTVLDDFFTGKLENLRGLEGRYALVRGSVVDRPLVVDQVGKHEIVFHLAARNIIASTKNPYEDYETNIGGTLNVLLAARAARIDRVVYSSSVSVYGNAQTLPSGEDDPVNLLTPYAVSKFGGEGYCRALSVNSDLAAAVVRYSNVYGPGQDPTNPYCGVVSRFMTRAGQGLAPEIFGDGQQTRDFTFIDDVIDATLLAAIAPAAVGKVFNVGTGIETSVNGLARLVLEMYGLSAEPTHVEKRDIDSVSRRVVNIDRIRRMLGWAPRVALDEGLRRTQRWFFENNRQ
jgi:UDP-glucose 4-epimerase